MVLVVTCPRYATVWVVVSGGGCVFRRFTAALLTVSVCSERGVDAGERCRSYSVVVVGST